MATLALATPAQAIVPNNNFTPAQIIDADGGVNGVGMFFRFDGFVCSGTLINPRTVLFAAHCVNDRLESDYDTNGVVPSAFSFDVNALPGFQNWIANGFASNPDLFVYNISQIAYHPDSIVRPQGFGFLEADIAIATLDTPAANIPTWALLFSPLPDPGPIDDVTGTGYHVNITGYGRSGTGTTGASQGIDWRRRAAENMLGSLSSLDDRNLFLFGSTFGDEGTGPLNPQVLYNIDFDDPNKTSPFDFNLYKDEPLQKEGTSAGGDSGGPLILDAANNALAAGAGEDLQIGVLSGGSRFFGPQVFSSYGTQSFYQPLFLFADYIASVNPYRYVSAKAGDGAWEDPTHWQTDLDPAYRIIDANGNVINGFPDAQSGGITQDTPKFGEVCFDREGDNPGDECFDFATGDSTPPSRPAPAPTPTPTSNIGEAQLPNAAPAEVASTTPVVPLVEASAAAQATSVTAAVGRPQSAANAAIRGEGMIVENAAISSGLTMVENVAINGGVSIVDDVAIRGGAQPVGDIAISGGAAPLAVVNDSEGGPEGAEEQPQAEGDPFPDPTLDNGLAGATNFVPDNIDADVAEGINARYFEVTLNRAGTTTLSSDVTIDRLNVGGAAGLVISSGASLTSLIDVNQTSGRIAVNGTLNSAGDYSLFSGMLTGNGTINFPGRYARVILDPATEADGSPNDFFAEVDDVPAVTNQQFLVPYLTSIAGMIAPGSLGGIGSLTVNGNMVLASGNALLIDFGANGVSDTISVRAVAPPNVGDDDFNENQLVTSGNVNIGGNVAFNPVAGFDSFVGGRYRLISTDRVTFGEDGERLLDLSRPMRDEDGSIVRDDDGNIVYNTIADPLTGTFDSGTLASVILVADFIYGTNFVDAVITAQSYQNVIDSSSSVQVSYATLMDNNRGNETVRGLFDFLDFTNSAATIRATFESWAPTTESTVQTMGRAYLDNVSAFHQNRISLADRSSNGGTVAVIGRPMQLAASSLGGFGLNGTAVLSAAAASANDTEVRSGGVNENMAIYLAGGFVNGQGGSMPLGNPGADDDFDGFFVAGGLEYYLDESSFVGISAYYSDVDATVALANSAQSKAIMGSIYGRKQMSAGLVLDGRLTLGNYNAETLRNVALGAQAFTLTTDDDSMIYAGEIGLSKEMDLLNAIIAPGIRARAAKINFSNVSEQGGGPALTIVRPDYTSVQGLAGVEFKSKPGKKLQLRASMNYVHEFESNPNSFGANFVGGNGAVVPFALVEPDRDWGEVGVGLRYNMGNVSFDLSADATVGRSDVSSQVYSGAVSFRF
ncbi:autotransporter domain-containing protein [Parasphingorhabdus sp.]|uniref:autotransporter domain-containing protein n=1 Tax=Parasphingorhabdus sp. TaxID=2709688 RepID=UPI003593F37C